MILGMSAVVVSLLPPPQAAHTSASLSNAEYPLCFHIIMQLMLFSLPKGTTPFFLAKSSSVSLPWGRLLKIPQTKFSCLIFCYPDLCRSYSHAFSTLVRDRWQTVHIVQGLSWIEAILSPHSRSWCLAQSLVHSVKCLCNG